MISLRAVHLNIYIERCLSANDTRYVAFFCPVRPLPPTWPRWGHQMTLEESHSDVDVNVCYAIRHCPVLFVFTSRSSLGLQCYKNSQKHQANRNIFESRLGSRFRMYFCRSFQTETLTVHAFPEESLSHIDLW